MHDVAVLFISGNLRFDLIGSFLWPNVEQLNTYNMTMVQKDFLQLIQVLPDSQILLFNNATFIDHLPI